MCVHAHVQPIDVAVVELTQYVERLAHFFGFPSEDLTPGQLVERAVGVDQFSVFAGLDEPSAFKNENPVGALDRAQTTGDRGRESRRGHVERRVVLLRFDV